MAQAGGADLSRKFVTETEIEEQKRQRQEEWDKVRKPEDPEEAPEDEYDPRSLFEKLQEQKDKKQEEYDEQFKFKNMVKGLDEDESHFLDEVSRQQSLVEKQRRDEEQQELREYRSALKKLATNESRKEAERKAGPKPAEQQRTSHLSQAHLLAGAVKRRSSSQSSDSSKKQKVEDRTAAGDRGQTEQEAGGGGGGGGGEPVARVAGTAGGVVSGGVLRLPSAAVCVGILPGLGAYSGSSDSESSSDSEV